MKNYKKPQLIKIKVDKNLSLVMASDPPIDPNGPLPSTPGPGIIGKAIRILIR